MCLTAPGSMKIGPLTLLLLCLLELTERSSMEDNGVTVWIRVEQKKPQIQKKEESISPHLEEAQVVTDSTNIKII